MPLDRRLRDGVDRLTSEFHPDVDASLDRTVRRARRTIAVRRAGAVLAVAASVVIAIVVAPRTLDALRNERVRSPAVTPPVTSPAFVSGRYQTVVPNDLPSVRQNGLAGSWTIAFGADGRMTVTAPRSFTGVVSGTLFQIQGDRFQTNLFMQDVCSNVPTDSYHWNQRGDELTFVTIDDGCEGRVAVFTSAPWTRVG